MTYTLCIVGAGGIAQSHLEAADAMPKLRTAAIADLDLARAKEAGEKYEAKAYTDYREMIETEKPDLVVLTLPHFLHREAAVWCLEQGCHVLLEKPMAITAGECDDIVEAARRSGRMLLVGHTQHYLPNNRLAREIVQSGQLGRLVMVQDHRHVHYYRDSRPAWFFERAKAGGGILMNLGTHSIDKLQWIVGTRIAAVKASLTRLGNRGDIEGSGIIYAETEAGVPATICQSGYGGVADDETMFLFTGGMLKLRTWEGVWVSDNGAFRKVEAPELRKPFVLQFEDMIAAIESGREPECSGEYGRSVIAAIEAVYRSCETGQEVLV